MNTIQSRLNKEIDEIKLKGVDITENNLIISESASLILPFHKELDEIREDLAGKKNKQKMALSSINKMFKKMSICDLSR